VDGVAQAALVFLGSGNGTFGTPKLASVGGVARYAAAADFDGDGQLDLAVTHDSKVGMLFGNGDGTFKPVQEIDVSGATSFIAAADLNNDKKVDLAFGAGSAVEARLGRGNGLFDPGGTLAFSGSPSAIAAGDLTADGRTDLVVGGSTVGDVTMAFDVVQGLSIYTQQLAVGTAAAIVVTDLNGDQKMDVAAASATDVAILIAGPVPGCP
jgi:hypothetical protein